MGGSNLARRVGPRLNMTLGYAAADMVQEGASKEHESAGPTLFTKQGAACGGPSQTWAEKLLARVKNARQL